MPLPIPLPAAGRGCGVEIHFDSSVFLLTSRSAAPPTSVGLRVTVVVRGSRRVPPLLAASRRLRCSEPAHAGTRGDDWVNAKCIKDTGNESLSLRKLTNWTATVRHVQSRAKPSQRVEDGRTVVLHISTRLRPRLRSRAA